MGKVKRNVVLAIVLAGLILSSSAWADLNDGLVAHWKLDGDAADSAGSNDGTIYGATPTTGYIDGALEFDGGDGVYIDGSAGTGSALNIYNTDLTISAWVKIDGTSGAGTIVARSKSHYTTYRLYVHLGNKAGINTYGSSGHWNLLTDEILDTNKWYHIVGVFDRGNDIGRVYVNGIEEASGPMTTDPPSCDAKTKIGCRNNTSDFPFDGTIDEVRIYNRVLAETEIEQLYQLTAAELLSLEIVGPDECPDDSQMQYKAIAHYDNDSTGDVSNSAVWSVEPDNMCSIDAGLLTTEIIDLPGDVVISAKYSQGDNTQTAQKDVSLFAICPSGTALEFDGVDDYVRVEDSPSLDITNEITAGAWVYSINTNIQYPNVEGIIVKNWRGNQSYKLFLHSNSKPCFEIRGNDGRYYSVSSEPITPNQWHHIVGMYDGMYLKIYVDGIEAEYVGLWISGIGSMPYQEIGQKILSTNDTPLFIGNDSYPEGRRKFKGIIDEAVIFNRALSAEEIQELMQSWPDTDDPNLVMYLSFDEGSDQLTADMSGNGNDGILGSTDQNDVSDPAWVYSQVPPTLCGIEDYVERNLINVLDIKKDVLDILNEAMGKEAALWEYMDTEFKNRSFGTASKGDVVKAKQKILSAMQAEQQATEDVDKSVGKLEDSLDVLGIEINDQ